MAASVGESLVLSHCGMPCDTFNAACRARLGPTEAEAAVLDAVAWFDGLPFSWWLTPGDLPAGLGDLLQRAGLQEAESELAMSAEVGTVSPPPDPEGLSIARVSSPEELESYAGLLARLWDPPDEDVLRFYRKCAPVLLAEGSPQTFYLGMWHGKAVATAEATWSAGTVGVYNISTVPAERGRGIGTAMTGKVLRDAAQRQVLLAILQAAQGAAGVYRRLGFREFGAIVEYQPATD